MARKSTPPSYLLHRQSGQAMTVVRAPDGRRQQVLLGPYGSEGSKTEYAQFVAEWSASLTRVTSRTDITAGPTISTLVERFKEHAALHYRHPDGSPTSEVNNYTQAFKLLTEMYGPTQVAEFSPLKLKALRAKWVDNGICRSQANGRASRVKRLFKWAAGEELVPFLVYQSLAVVQGLQRGRTVAAEPDPVVPVQDVDIKATLPYLLPPARDLVRILRFTGMRPSEACMMRWRDIDQSAEVWVYRPAQHKTGWRGKGRTVLLGPIAREVLASYTHKQVDQYLFDPRDAVAMLHAERASRRVTKYYQSRQGWQKESLAHHASSKIN